jgi:hypothetical protein
LKKRSYDDMDDDAWRRGSGSIEEKVEIDHVSCTKPKKLNYVLLLLVRLKLPNLNRIPMPMATISNNRQTPLF